MREEALFQAGLKVPATIKVGIGAVGLGLVQKRGHYFV